MGIVIVTVNMNTFVRLFFWLLTLQQSAGQNPCQDMTVGDCTLDDNLILESHPYPAAICHDQCGPNDLCSFWRYDEPKNECLFLKTNYHQDCKSFAGPIEGSIEDCLAVDQSTCDAILNEDCTFAEDTRMPELEQGPGSISSITECQELARALEVLGVDFFYFLIETEECRLFGSVPEYSCTATGGSPDAPPIDEC